MLKIHPLFELFILSCFGASFALYIDNFASVDASLLQSCARYIAKIMEHLITPGMATPVAVIALTLGGAASIFYFRPLSRKGAFTCGFAAIATLALFVP